MINKYSNFTLTHQIAFNNIVIIIVMIAICSFCLFSCCLLPGYYCCIKLYYGSRQANSRDRTDSISSVRSEQPGSSLTSNLNIEKQEDSTLTELEEEDEPPTYSQLF